MNNEQREVIYAERRKVLDGDNMRDLVLKMITDIVENAVDMSISDDQISGEVGSYGAEQPASADHPLKA